MINRVIFMGRLVADPQLMEKDTGEKMVYWMRFRIAVNRKFKRDGEPEADFFTCVAFNARAKYLDKHGRKGGRVIVEGWMRTNDYEKDGKTVRGYEMVVENCEVADYRNARNGAEDTGGREDYQTDIEERIPYQGNPGYMDDYPYNG